jgi:hypothetical protein
LSDVFLPAKEEVFALSAVDPELEGTIVSFSDSGLNADYFAVVDVVRRQSVVVAVDRLDIIAAEEDNMDG